jgi:hypothetical protein
MDWHRQFGLMLTDFFTKSPFVVEMEKDLSIKQQFLDIVIVRKRRGRFTERLPDGLDDLVEHNLITFKSHQEALDDWALKELTGHYVNYRKQIAEAEAPLLPETAFKLYAVCSRFPHNLAQSVPWERVQEGVYQCRRGTDVIRVVVAGQLPQSEHNAMLHLFSSAAEQWVYGVRHCRPRSPDTSTLIYQLYQGYLAEGITMPYTMEDFRRDFRKEFMKEMTPEEKREILKSLTPEQLVEGLSPEQRKKLLEQLNAREAATKPEKRRGK